MRFFFSLLLITACLSASAQESVPPTDAVTISGKVKQPFTFRLQDAGAYPRETIDSLVIYNHLHQPKKTVRQLAGFPLTAILDKAGLAEDNPKLRSGYYFTCVASDGYQIVFSWNELYNSPAGDKVLLVLEENGLAGSAMPDRLLLVSAGDINTGRRYLKGLKEIRVATVN